MKSCRDCRDWSNCKGRHYEFGEFYEMSEIRYCRYQVLWIIDRFLNCVGDQIIMERDTWPDEFEASGYTDAENASRSVRALAPNEAVRQIVCEISVRLERTSKDGHLLVSQVRNSAELGKPARDALSYSSGWRRKRLGYKAWLRQRTYRNTLTTKTHSLDGT